MFQTTLTGHSFVALSPMIMNSSSFESLKPYLFLLNLENSVPALLKYVILALTLVILYYTNVVKYISHSTVFGKRGVF